MPSFRYKAVADSGEVLEGEMQAENRAAVIGRLHELGHTPIRADEVRAGTAGSIFTRDLLGERRVRIRDVTLLTRELATLLHAGLPLERALDIMAELADRPNVGKLLARVLERVRGGATLADALEAAGKVFPTHYVSMVRAGEAGATLDAVLDRLADFMERSLAIRGQVRSALIYPAFLLGMSGVSLFILMWVVVPNFKPLFDEAGATLPLLTRMVIGLSTGLESYWWAVIAGLLAIVLIFRTVLRNPNGRLAWDRWLLSLPILGNLVAGLEVAKFSRTMGTLLANGVPMLAALSLVRDMIANRAMAAAFGDVAGSLRGGQGFAEPLDRTGMFPKLAVHLLRIGEESGRLEDMLFKLAEIYETESQRLIQRLLVLLVPVITVGLGLLIAFIIASILFALLSANELAF